MLVLNHYKPSPFKICRDTDALTKGNHNLPLCVSFFKLREFQKASTFASLTTLKLLTVWITRNCGKFFKRWEYQTTLPAS